MSQPEGLRNWQFDGAVNSVTSKQVGNDEQEVADGMLETTKTKKDKNCS